MNFKGEVKILKFKRKKKRPFKRVMSFRARFYSSIINIVLIIRNQFKYC